MKKKNSELLWIISSSVPFCVHAYTGIQYIHKFSSFYPSNFQTFNKPNVSENRTKCPEPEVFGFQKFYCICLAWCSPPCLQMLDGFPISYRFDGKLFIIRRLQDKSKVQTDVLDELLYADDTAKNASTERKMQEAMNRVSQACDNYDLKISTK